MFALLKVAAGVSPFAAWMPYSETIGRSRSEKLDAYLKVLYDLLRDVLDARTVGPDLGDVRLRFIDARGHFVCSSPRAAVMAESGVPFSSLFALHMADARSAWSWC